MADEETLRGDFGQFDKDKNGSIDRAEFAELLDFLGEELSENQVEVAFRALDSDGSGQIDFSEFKEWWLKYQDVQTRDH